MKDILVIVGPTGVGKTRLSIELAKAFDAEIINGDSVSIYKELNIGSAKPTIEEREGIPHYLIDIRSIDEDYSVFDYQRDCRSIISKLESNNKQIIIVGGTGFYIKSALYDYRFQEGTTNKSYDDLSNIDLYNKIKSYNIETPDINNRVRLVRLLNKLENGEEITNYKDKCLYNIKVIGLTTDRDVLYRRINDRVDKMIDSGLIDEVEGLKGYYNTSRVLNSAIGYKEFRDYFFKGESLEEVIDSIKKDSRHFAKRQYTYFNHQFDTKWFMVDFDNFQNTIDDVYKYIRQSS